MFGKLGWPEIAIILVIVLIVFGVGKLPQVGGAIGKGLRAFRKGQSGGDSEEEPETSAQSELEATKTKLEAMEAKLKTLEESAKKSKTTKKISKDSTKLS